MSDKSSVFINDSIGRDIDYCCTLTKNFDKC